MKAVVALGCLALLCIAAVNVTPPTLSTGSPLHNPTIQLTENYVTNNVTWAQFLFVDTSTNTYQFVTLGGYTQLRSTNRTAGAGLRQTTLYIKGAATNCWVTNHASWVNYGTNGAAIFQVPANKWAKLELTLTGTDETDVHADLRNQTN